MKCIHNVYRIEPNKVNKNNVGDFILGQRKRNFLLVERKKRELTQKDVAEYLGVTRSRYNQIENGRSDPSFKLAIKIAKFFNVDLNRLSR